jgi:hypothetical protein
MADHADDGGNGVFIYMGGGQVVPRDVTHVRVHKSVKIIRACAFRWCRKLASIEIHDGVEIIEGWAFYDCRSLRGINLKDVRVIGEYAFHDCTALTDVEFGDKLETIKKQAFKGTALRSINLPKVRIIGNGAFWGCNQLMEAELSKDLETIGEMAFVNCHRLRRIAMPLKNNLFADVPNCGDLSQVDLVGGIHKTISSLLLGSWRDEMNDEIDRINQDLPNVNCYHKTAAIQQWMEASIRRVEHYKSEHYALLKEFTTLLELALWKAKLDESQDERSIGSDQSVKKAKIDTRADNRQEQRITSGANIVIRNVLPFLKLE